MLFRHAEILLLSIAFIKTKYLSALSRQCAVWAYGGAALRSAATEDGVQPWVLPSLLPYASRFLRVAFFGRPGVLLRCSRPGLGQGVSAAFRVSGGGRPKRPTKTAPNNVAGQSEFRLAQIRKGVLGAQRHAISPLALISTKLRVSLSHCADLPLTFAVRRRPPTPASSVPADTDVEKSSRKRRNGFPCLEGKDVEGLKLILPASYGRDRGQADWETSFGVNLHC